MSEDGWLFRFIRKPISVPLYAFLILGVVATLGPLGSLLASVKIADSNDQERIAAEAQTAAASRVIVCAWFSAWLDTWDEVPPTTEAGRRVQVRTLELYGITGCQPTRR